ncbi:MAG: XdhC family protein [bacterium]
MDKHLLNKLISWDEATPAVLCSQVAWKGSVPRKDYPSMLVLDGGRTFGTVGGGSMENLVIQRALEVLDHGRPVLADFDMSSNDVEGEAGICGGWTRMLIEPVTREVLACWKSLSEAFDKSETVTVLTIIQGDPVSIERTVLHGRDPAPELPEKVKKLIERAKNEQRSVAAEEEATSFLIEYLKPTPRLHILGAGHVGQALAEVAHFIELDVCIYDDRPDLANAERFPHAVRIDCGSYDHLASRAKIAPDDYVVIATRGHQHDLQMLRWLLEQEISYLGLMSSRRKWSLIAKTLEKEGNPKQTLDRIHVPVGLDLKAETVPEIAISIISEIIHHLRTHRRSAASLTFNGEGGE